MTADTRTDIVVLGGGYAGLTAALRLAPRHRVTLVDPRDRFVERIRSHQVAAGQDGAVHPYRKLLAGTGIRHVAGRAVALDPAGRTVAVETGDGHRLDLGYQRLVYALGSRTRVPALVPAPATAGATRVYSAETAAALAARLAGRDAPVGRLAVVGGGLTGIEMATELAEAHPDLEIRLLTAGTLAATLSEPARDHLRATLDRLGVEVEEGSAVDDPDRVDADAVLWSAAMAPATELAAEAGLALDEQHRIRVDAALRSVSHPEIVVAGDAGAGWRMACATAMPTGAHAAGTILREARGVPARPFHLKYVLVCMSLGRSDGLVQVLHRDDRPRDLVLTGRPAARVKELIVSGTAGLLGYAGKHPAALRALLF
ncbi:FAD-dependent oxidoreductase [Actinoplanes oblitus]|uniref:FAD-dependent oxidoreductase n=1 Tax=Actinoplanes oblitus TaxID=3040509 RepID=A0ABY8WU47_9ACTN|nr:FAD-dependent oxidoreductase [Actinoplanes oblitus]WIM99360.1 FAD-dependent oxidoreductase [Actinoplanes oblitus]